jgi:hypothetical protein
MKNSNRDLLVLVRDGYADQDAIQNELQQLNRMLIRFETTENFCIAHEVFDVNKYRVITRLSRLKKFVERDEIKPFVFVFNKN